MSDPLTPREKQIAQFIYEGRLNQGIADILGVSHRTVEIHRHRLMEKFGASNTAELVQNLRTFLEAENPETAAHDILILRLTRRVEDLERRLKLAESQLSSQANRDDPDEAGPTQS